MGAIAGCGIGRGVKAQNHKEFFKDSGQIRQRGADVRNGQKQDREVTRESTDRTKYSESCVTSDPTFLIKGGIVPLKWSPTPGGVIWV